MKNSKNHLNDLNSDYLEELELNNQLFQQKLNNLTNLISDNNNSNPKKSISNKKYQKKDIDKLEKEIFGKNDNNEVNKIENFDSNSNNEININNLNNYTFKKKESNKIVNNNELDNNLELKKKIQSLEKENNYKDYLINDLRNQIMDKNKKEKISHTNCNDYNKLIKEIEDKNYKIDILENKLKLLQLKIDNLILDNKNLSKENDILNNKIGNYEHDADINKNDSLNYLQKINDLKSENKKLNIELINLSKEYNIIKKEKENLKSIIDEQKVIIFDYQKQLNYKTINKSQSNYNENIKYEYDNIYKTFSPREYGSTEKYNFSPQIKKKVRNENYNLNVKENYRYNKENGDYFGKKYDYYRNDYGDGTLDYITEKSKELKKSEINYLENYLSSLLK